MTKEIIIGSSGFVGSEYVKHSTENLYTPTSIQLDITNIKSIKNYIKSIGGADIIVNFAAYTNTKVPKQEIDNKTGRAWKLNVEGPKNLAKVCKELDLYLITLSTDNVFLGKDGPFKENTKPSNSGGYDWYGYTKLLGETEILKSEAKSAIVRIAYPFGNPTNSKDLFVKILNLISKGYGLFSDQFITPSSIDLINLSINSLIKHKNVGIFHVACTGVVSPYKIGLKLREKLGFQQEIKSELLETFEKKNGNSSLPFKGGLDTKNTQKKLRIRFHSWQEALEKYCDKYDGQLPNISS